MEKSIRRLASELNGFILSRLTAPRKKLCVPVSVSLDEGSAKGVKLSVAGETKDLSKSGIAFFAPCVRLGDKYLVGENRLLLVEMNLPNGKIKMRVRAVRYEQIGIHDSTAKYMIGAQIDSISDADRILYEEYLRFGDALKNAEQKDFTAETAPEG